MFRCDLGFNHIIFSNWQSIICPASRTTSDVCVGYVSCVFMSWCKSMLMCPRVCVCECLPLSLALMIDNVLPFPPTPPSPFLPLLTLLSAACHRDFLMSSIEGLYLDGQSPPLMYLMPYLGYCIWQGGKLSVSVWVHSCFSLFKRAECPHRSRKERKVHFASHLDFKHVGG